MSRILVVWEDDEFQELHRVLKRRVSARRPATSSSFPHVLSHTVRGNGSFSNYVRRTWPRGRARGMPNDGGPIDHLICVADADKIDRLLPSTSAPPASGGDVPSWHAAAEHAWHSELRSQCDGSVPAETVHGILLRWSKESLVLSAYDLDPARTSLRIDVDASGARAMLDACTPRPNEVAAPAFTDHYRSPMRCIGDLQKALGIQPVKKNAPAIDDLLRALDRGNLDLVATRVPDLDRIADLVWRLDG